MAKRKLTPAKNAEKKRRQKEFMTIFINCKMKRVKRPPTIDGMSVDDFIGQNADPIWLHQNEMWELMVEEEDLPSSSGKDATDYGDIPF